jgi:hypothetical protein
MAKATAQRRDLSHKIAQHCTRLHKSTVFPAGQWEPHHRNPAIPHQERELERVRRSGGCVHRTIRSAAIIAGEKLSVTMARHYCTLLSLVGVLGFTLDSVVAQELTASAAPQAAPLTWQRLVCLRDGRAFVTDGRFSLDAEVAKPAALPTHILPEQTAKLVEGYLTAELPDKVTISQLTRAGENYTAPDGILLSRVYVDYLRHTLPPSQLCFRMKSDAEPIVILLNGKAVGLLMPMKR